MTRRQHASSRVTIFRPDTEGRLVRAGTAPASGVPSATVRGGAQYGLWDDLVQTWAHEAPMMLEQCARALCDQSYPDSCAVSFWRGEFFPAPLNSAERKLLRALVKEGSE